jgi:DNA-binding response OmpR family regulator
MRVLLVEDDAAMAASIELMLKRESLISARMVWRSASFTITT